MDAATATFEFVAQPDVMVSAVGYSQINCTTEAYFNRLMRQLSPAASAATTTSAAAASSSATPPSTTAASPALHQVRIRMCPALGVVGARLDHARSSRSSTRQVVFDGCSGGGGHGSCRVSEAEAARGWPSRSSGR